MIVHANPQQAARGEVIYGIGDFADEMAFLLRYSMRGDVCL